MRRQLILGGFNLTLLLFVSSAIARAEESAPVPAHCQLIQSDELQAIVGDCARSGMGGPQYCGLWSLTSKQQQFNCFGNSYAGLLPGELRGRPNTTLQVVDDKTAVLYKPVSDQDSGEAKATYRFIGPNCLEHTLVMKDARPPHLVRGLP